MWDLFRLIFGLVVDLFRSRAALEAEVLVLKQQIIVLRRGKPNRMPFLAVNRVVLGWACHLFPKARGALAIVRLVSTVNCSGSASMSGKPALPSIWCAREGRRRRAGRLFSATTQMGSRRWTCLLFRPSRFGCSMDC